jgi:SpoIID/LytB domain protein
MGWSPTRILTHFYRGTDVRSPALPARVRVELTANRQVVHLTAQGGRVRIFEGEPRQGRLVGEIRGGQTWRLIAADRGFSVRDDAGTQVGGHRWGGPSRPLVLVYETLGARVFVPEADEVRGDGFAYARGTIEAQLTACATTCRTRLIGRLTLEDYLYGLGEVPTSWPVPAMRAQAIAARTFAAYGIRRGLRAGCDCHLADGASDQVYIGWDREAQAMGDRWVAAVDATRGKAITYHGNLIQAFYASSDGGHSEDVEDVWHDGNPAFAIPWLRGVCDPGESTPANAWTDWTRTFDAQTLTSRLAPYTGRIGVVRSLTGATRGRSGRIITIRAVGATGSARIEGTELRAALGLPDTRVWVNADRTIEGAIRERYDALMCAPGLATSADRKVRGGAQQFFERGGLYRNADRRIVVWLKGAVDAEYRAVGAADGVLGLPLGAPRVSGRAVPCDGCRRLDLDHGRIYWKAGIGAHALWGRILAAYGDEGGATGHLGWPRTRVRRPGGGVQTARFEHGRISCTAGSRCTVTAT